MLSIHPDIYRVLLKEPHLAKELDTSVLSGFEVSSLAEARPEIIPDLLTKDTAHTYTRFVLCNLAAICSDIIPIVNEYLNCAQRVRLIKADANNERHFDMSSISHDQWATLICHDPAYINHPVFMEEVGVDALRPEDYTKIIVIQPTLAHLFDVQKIGPSDWAYILESGNLAKLVHPHFVSVDDCGQYSRSIVIDKRRPTVINIGCFCGTKEEAIACIRDEYQSGHVLDYMAKVNECFNKLGE